ncbi:MAG: hypothetical protein AABZ60_19865 [Planctomycetota bacterium]
MKKEINFCCLSCGQGIELIEPFAPQYSCHSCQKTFSFNGEALDLLSQCGICQGNEFYLQKDFNRSLGLFVVVLSGLISFILFALDFPPLYFFLPLVVAPILDSLLYRICPFITICYRCEGIYRQFQMRESIEGFDLATSSRLKIQRK